MSQEAKTRAKNIAGEIIIDGIEDALDDSESPVQGGKFKSKKADGTLSRLLDKGDMRFSLESKNRKGDDIEIGVFKKKERAKAYGHTTGFKGHKFLDKSKNKREFIPGKSQLFDKGIMNEVTEAIEDIKEFDEFKKDQKKPKGLRTVGALGLVATATETPKELQSTFDILIGELFGEFNAN